MQHEKTFVEELVYNTKTTAKAIASFTWFLIKVVAPFLMVTFLFAMTLKLHEEKHYVGFGICVACWLVAIMAGFTWLIRILREQDSKMSTEYNEFGIE
jgi:hypothetical protein